MANPRPCRVCSCWFSPSGKVGSRQHVCGKPECQKEWHRRACARWRQRHPDEARARKVVHQVTRKAPAERPVLDPLVAINWRGVRKAVGLKPMIVLREITKVLQRALRETSFAQAVPFQVNTSKVLPRSRRETSSQKPILNQQVAAKVLPSPPRDEMASGSALP
jgi:hypothetical protein